MELTEASGFSYDPIDPLRFDIGRIGIDETVLSVPLPNELQGVFVLQRHVLQPCGHRRKQFQKVFDIHALYAEGGDRRAEAAPDGEVIRRRPFYIEQCQPLLKNGEQLPGLFLRKTGAVAQTRDLRLHILIVDLLVGDKVAVILEKPAAVDGQEFQLPQQNVGALLDAGIQVHQLGIQVIIDVQAAWVLGQSQQHRAAAAEGLHILHQLRGEGLQDVGRDLLLAADPRKGRLSHVRPPHAPGSVP